jgi:hypothetical protein
VENWNESFPSSYFSSKEISSGKEKRWYLQNHWLLNMNIQFDDI